MEKNLFITAVFVSLLLLSASGMKVMSFAFAQLFLTVTIEADGSISPSTAPLTKSGNLYTLTGDLYGEVFIEKSDVVFDGGGHMITCGSRSYAVRIAPSTPISDPISNVVVKNVIVTQDENADQWANGIFLESTFNSIIANNTVFNMKDGTGISIFDFSTGNVVVGNNVTNINGNGIWVWDRNNTITANYITGNSGGIRFSDWSDNVVVGNHIADNQVGIACWAGNPIPPGLVNLFYYNNFVNNNLTFLNEAIFISGTGVLLYPAMVNVWDNGAIGNYWGDYNGTDDDGDGIGDTPYFIDDHYNLDVNDTDHYPLISPINIDSLSNHTFLSSLIPADKPLPPVPDLSLPAVIVALVSATSVMFAVRRKSSLSKVPQKSLTGEMQVE